MHPGTAAPSGTTVRPQVKTEIAVTTSDAIFVRGHDLAADLIGRVGYTEMLLLTSLGRMPSASERAVVDAIAVSLMDHGITPSSLSARLTYLGAPESFQAAVAAGLLGAGSAFLGGMTEVTTLLIETASGLHDDDDDDVFATAADGVVAGRLDEGRKVPGLGHNVHTESDPRVARHREVAREHGIYDKHWRLVDAWPAAFARARGKELPMNNVGAVGAQVAALGLPAEMGRGIALAARAGGLVAHLLEEVTSPMAKLVWENVLDDLAAGPQAGATTPSDR